jgi:hypothetical protein
MKIMPEFLIDEIVQYCYYEPVFNFLKTAILVSIDDPCDYHISRSTLLKVMKVAQMERMFARLPSTDTHTNFVVSRGLEYLENVANCVKEMSINI